MPNVFKPYLTRIGSYMAQTNIAPVSCLTQVEDNQETARHVQEQKHVY